MYVLLYTNADGLPCYAQGTLENINAYVKDAFINGEINQDDWDLFAPFNLLCIEDGALTPVNEWELQPVPQFVVN